MNLQFTTLASPSKVTGTILNENIAGFSVQAISDTIAEVKFAVQTTIVTLPVRPFTINGKQVRISTDSIRSTVQFTAKVPLNAELLYDNKVLNKGISQIDITDYVDFSAKGINITQIRFVHDEALNQLIESDIEVEDAIVRHIVEEAVTLLLEENVNNRKIVLELVLSSPIMH